MPSFYSSLRSFTFLVSAQVSVYSPQNYLTKVSLSQIKYITLFISLTVFISICPVYFRVVNTLQ